MRLSEWVKEQGAGAITRLQVRSGCAYTTILRAVNGGGITKRTAQKIADATDGAVTAGEIFDEACEDEEPAEDAAE